MGHGLVDAGLVGNVVIDDKRNDAAGPSASGDGEDGRRAHGGLGGGFEIGETAEDDVAFDDKIAIEKLPLDGAAVPFGGAPGWVLGEREAKEQELQGKFSTDISH